MKHPQQSVADWEKMLPELLKEIYIKTAELGGTHRYFEDLNRAPNPATGGRPKDFFEMASNALDRGYP
jgi:hypothetical protein